ncbi:MAG: FadR family transcriptional regulator [Clostridiales bacterium]|nr:FadR family transcriptional regulator [Clostridiales bacterium]
MENLYVTIFNQIEMAIREGKMVEDQRLSERKLAEQYNVSRTVIREALKVLSEKGLVTCIVGKGNYVTKLDQRRIINKFEMTMNNGNLDMQDVAEARQIIEVAMVEKITERAEAIDLAELKDLVRLMKQSIPSGDDFTELDGRFHIRLMECSKNQVMMIFGSALNSMIDREALRRNYELRVKAQKEHEKILEALEHRDKIQMMESMLAHISCFQQLVRKV